MKVNLREHVFGQLPAEGFILTIEKGKALVDAIAKLKAPADKIAAAKATHALAIVLATSADVAPARAWLRELVDKVQLSQEMSASMRAAKF